MVKKIEDEPLKNILRYGMYSVTLADMSDTFYVCNICGLHMELREDVLEHIVDIHLSDTLPDVDPGNVDEDEDTSEPVLDPNELEIV